MSAGATSIMVAGPPGPVAASGGRTLLDQLEEGHRRCVAAPRRRPDHPGVPATPLLIPRRHGGEQPLDHRTIGEHSGDLPTRVQVVLERQVDHPVGDLLRLLRLVLGGRRLLVHDKRRHQTAEQGEPRPGVPSQAPSLLSQAHQAPLRRNSSPRAASFSLTSSSDFRPKFLTFTTSSSVRWSRSPRVLIPARFRQLYGRTDRSSSSIGIVASLFVSSACGPTATSAPAVVPTNRRK